MSDVSVGCGAIRRSPSLAAAESDGPVRACEAVGGTTGDQAVVVEISGEGVLPVERGSGCGCFPACATRDNAGAIDIPNAEFVFKCSFTGEENFVSR